MQQERSFRNFIDLTSAWSCSPLHQTFALLSRTWIATNYRPESYLKKLIVSQLVKDLPASMESKGSLPSSQKVTIEACHEQAEYIPYLRRSQLCMYCCTVSTGGQLETFHRVVLIYVKAKQSPWTCNSKYATTTVPRKVCVGQLISRSSADPLCNFQNTSVSFP